MIDFTDLPVRNKTYAGANGSKISALYQDALYMLKFPATASINKQMNYANGCVLEYLGCHVFESSGIPVQKTLLGTYTKNGKSKIVVACKDFTTGGLALQDFAFLKNTISVGVPEVRNVKNRIMTKSRWKCSHRLFCTPTRCADLFFRPTKNCTPLAALQLQA